MRLLWVKRLIVKLSQWRLYESSKNHVANVWLRSILFSETLLSTFHFSLLECLKQQWFLKSILKELLAQKDFCWPSTGWPEHALGRGASFAMAEGTASPTYSSLKGKQRGFCCPRKPLLVWKHFVLLVLPSLGSPQTAEVSQSSGLKWRAEAPAVSQQVDVSASISLSPALTTLWKTRKHFLADSVEDSFWSNTLKTWSEKHAEVSSTSVMNPGSTARLSSSQLLWCSDQAAGASTQERIRVFQLTLFHPNFSQLKGRLSTADK